MNNNKISKKNLKLISQVLKIEIESTYNDIYLPYQKKSDSEKTLKDYMKMRQELLPKLEIIENNFKKIKGHPFILAGLKRDLQDNDVDLNAMRAAGSKEEELLLKMEIRDLKLATALANVQVHLDDEDIEEVADKLKFLLFNYETREKNMPLNKVQIADLQLNDIDLLNKLLPQEVLIDESKNAELNLF